MNVNQTKIQEEAIDKWIEKGYTGTIELATAGGKSKIGVMAASLVYGNGPILIISPTQIIRDKEWREQFKKWSDIPFEDIKSCCIQTCYKWIDTHWALIILDEIHRYIPKNDTINYKYYKFFQNNTWDKILGLSGSISKDITFRLNKIAPVIYTLNTNEARDLDIISPFEIYNLPVELDETEKATYNKLSKGIEACKIRGYHNWKLINQRRFLLYNAKNKLKNIIELTNHLKGQGIVFSQLTDYADELAMYLNCESYHSRLNKKEKEKGLAKFLNGESRLLSAAMALDEGFNLPNLNFAIIAAGTSKERSFIQRLGRIIRKVPDKKAILVRLYVKDTKDEEWLRNSQKGFKVKFINKISEIYEKESVLCT